MFKKLSEAVQSYRTKGLAVLGIIIGVAGVLWGPVTLGPVEIPKFNANDVWQIIWVGGLAIFLHDKKGA